MKFNEWLDVSETLAERKFAERPQKSPTIYFDMDGVLSDFDKDFRKYTGKSPSDYGEEIDDVLAKLVSEEGFFENMSPISGFSKIRSAINKMVKDGYDVQILTAVGKNSDKPKVVRQKRKWLRNNGLGDIPFNWVPSSKDKAQYANPETLLIDDREKAAAPFEQNGGSVVRFQSADQALRQLKDVIGY